MVAGEACEFDAMSLALSASTPPGEDDYDAAAAHTPHGTNGGDQDDENEVAIVVTLFRRWRGRGR